MTNFEEKSRAPFFAHRMSFIGGLAVIVAWLCYVIYLIVTSAELPDSDEALSVLGVTIVLFALGWLAVRITHHFATRIHRRVLARLAR